MCDPILATLLKMRPHYGQSIHENATPSSGTSPLASYKEVPPPPAVKLLRSYKRPKFTSRQLFARCQRVICLLSVSSWCFEKAIDYKATFTPLCRVRSYFSPRRAGSQAYTLSIVTSLLTRRGGGGRVRRGTYVSNLNITKPAAVARFEEEATSLPKSFITIFSILSCRLFNTMSLNGILL